MKQELITVVETTSFMTDAKVCMTNEERTEAINMIAANPECGDIIPGGGGIRKVRFGIGGRGKSGGVRIIYYFTMNGSLCFYWRYLPRTNRLT